MKKTLWIVMAVIVLSCTSCGTLFTPSSQDITFTGLPGTGIYDKGKLVTQIQDNGIGNAKIRKQLSSKTMTAKKEGYVDTPFKLESVFNPISVINLTNPIAWAIDLGTGKCCKWGDEIIEIQIQPK